MLSMGLLITYRRTGGWMGLLGFAAVLTAALLTITAAVTLLIVTAAMGVVVFLARAVSSMSWRRPTPPPATPWPSKTIESTVVDPRDASSPDTP